MSETEIAGEEPGLEPVEDAQPVEEGGTPALDAPVDAALEELAEPAESPPAPIASADGDLLRPVLDVPVELVVELGRTTMTIGDTLKIGKGSIVVLDKEAGSPSDLKVNGRLIARGEVVAIDEEFGLRVTEVVALEHLFDTSE
jgi:flagellar motor switch protein FliN/FliY